MILKDKHIILGITGSIAAYKAAYIIRGLVKKGAEVQVVITPAGKEFITPLTLSTLSSHPVISEFLFLRHRLHLRQKRYCFSIHLQHSLPQDRLR